MRRPIAVTGLIILFILIFRIIKYDNPPEYYNLINSIAGENITITGIAVKSAIKNDNQVLYLKNVTSDDVVFPKNNNIGAVCYLDTQEDVATGSFVVLSGIIKPFDCARNEGEFDSLKYYLSIGYSFSVKEGKVIYMEKSKNPADILSDALRHKLEMNADEIFYEDDAGVMKAMILGTKDDLNKDIKKMYQKAGISHILAISGLHISIIGMFVFMLLRKLGINPFITAFFPGIIMLFYGKMTGNGISTIRAVCMFELVMLAFVAKRTYDIVTALVLAALFIIIINPYACMSSSFYLSFLAVTGIAVFSKSIMPGRIKSQNIIAKLAKGFMSGLAVNLFTLPVILYNYYEYPLYSVILNILVVPLMGVLLGLGIIACFTASVNVYLGAVFAIPCHYILFLYSSLCKICEKMPWAHIVLGKPSFLSVAVYYLLMMLIMLIHNYENEKYREKLPVVKAAFKIILIAAGIIIMIKPSDKLKIVMYDVGQGDGILISSNDINIMVDGGSSSKKDIGSNILVPGLKASGVSDIDYWLVSHPDSDHTSGLMDILSDYGDITIKQIVLPDTATIKSDAADILTLAAENNIQTGFVKRGDRLIYKDLKITFINPDSGIYYTDINTYSEAFLLEYNDFKMLFTGDATLESEEAYLKYCRDNGISLKDTDILKVPHHGSTSSSGEELLSEITPDNALISCGIGNRYGHPSYDVVERLNICGSRIYDTRQCGQITVRYKKDGYIISEFLRNK